MDKNEPGQPDPTRPDPIQNGREEAPLKTSQKLVALTRLYAGYYASMKSFK